MVGEAERRRRFGYALQRALEVRGMSERQLAMRLEIDPRRVARWRTGKDLPDLYETQELVDALRVREELFRNPPEVPEPPPYPIERYLVESEMEAVAEDAAGYVIAEEPIELPRAEEPADRDDPRPEPVRPGRRDR